MNDKQLARLLDADEGPIAAVLMNRGGWLSSPGAITIAAYFPSDDNSPALWQISLGALNGEPYHVFYTTADAIVGVSIKRNGNALQQE